MPWISRDGSLTQAEMENNANIVINYYRTLAYADATIAALLGNMQNESTINPAYADATIAALLGNMQNESTINPAAKMESEDAVDK